MQVTHQHDNPQGCKHTRDSGTLLHTASVSGYERPVSPCPVTATLRPVALRRLLDGPPLLRLRALRAEHPLHHVLLVGRHATATPRERRAAFAPPLLE